jgi:hypothetical protein
MLREWQDLKSKKLEVERLPGLKVEILRHPEVCAQVDKVFKQRQAKQTQAAGVFFEKLSDIVASPSDRVTLDHVQDWKNHVTNLKVTYNGAWDGFDLSYRYKGDEVVSDLVILGQRSVILARCLYTNRSKSKAFKLKGYAAQIALPFDVIPGEFKLFHAILLAWETTDGTDGRNLLEAACGEVWGAPAKYQASQDELFVRMTLDRFAVKDVGNDVLNLVDRYNSIIYDKFRMSCAKPDAALKSRIMESSEYKSAVERCKVYTEIKAQVETRLFLGDMKEAIKGLKTKNPALDVELDVQMGDFFQSVSALYIEKQQDESSDEDTDMDEDEHRRPLEGWFIYDDERYSFYISDDETRLFESNTGTPILDVSSHTRFDWCETMKTSLLPYPVRLLQWLATLYYHEDMPCFDHLRDEIEAIDNIPSWDAVISSELARVGM